MQLALSGHSSEPCEPLDWLHNTAPEQWLIGKQRVVYRWSEPIGASPFVV
jgi:hypothetical protein